MNSLLIPLSEATLGLEQAFQLIVQSSLPTHSSAEPSCLPQAWLVKGESGSSILVWRLLALKDRGDVLIQAPHAA